MSGIINVFLYMYHNHHRFTQTHANTISSSSFLLASSLDLHNKPNSYLTIIYE